MLKVSLDGRKRRLEQLASRDRDDVERPIAVPGIRRRPAPEHFAQPALRAIAFDRTAEPSRRDDPHAVPLQRIRQAEQGHVARGDPPAALLHRDELMA